MEETTQEDSTPQKAKNMTPVILAVIVILVLIGGYVGYKMMKSTSSQKEKMETKTQESGESVKNTRTSSESAKIQVRTIEVTGANYSFSPSTLVIRKGVKVNITFKNSGGMHSFVVDELNIKTKVIKDGEQETVSFTPEKAGTFEFYCSVGNHRAMGMKGTITVQ